MPELPEVETIRRGLNELVIGQEVLNAQILCEKSFVGEFVVGKITDLRRFGKALIIDLDNGYSLMIHLRMTGQLIYESNVERFAGGHPNESFVEELPNKQTRVILKLSRGNLYFNDQRKFGFIKVLPSSEVEKDDFIRKLAPEPWQMKVERLKENLARHKNSAIKTVILDQTVVAGLGNIYADEALYASGIHPERKAGSLSEGEIADLLAKMREVMEKSLQAGGSTIKNYVKADGTRGDYLDLFAKVYHREGCVCEKCGGKIVKIKLGGRGTHFCPECQK